MNYGYSVWKRIFLNLLLIILLMGCGVKAPPVVPRSPIPQTVKDLEAFSRRGTIFLQWSIPKKDADGKKLVNLGGFHIWRQFVPSEKKGCASCKPDFELLIELEHRLPQKSSGEGKMIYWDSQVEKEGTYSYYLSSYTTVGVESMGSNLVEVNWFPPLPPPLSLKTHPGDRVVDLSWESLLSEKREQVRGFNIYRRYQEENYSLTPLNQSPIIGNNFQDISVTNGEKYFYVVRSLKNTAAGAIEGKDSNETEVIPEDLTPPATPSATLAFQAPDGVVITWEPNLDPDLEGYFIYRRLEREAKPKRISPLLKQETMYLDKTFSPGFTYYYSITAIDHAPRHNESDFSQELKVVTEQ